MISTTKQVRADYSIAAAETNITKPVTKNYFGPSIVWYCDCWLSIFLGSTHVLVRGYSKHFGFEELFYVGRKSVADRNPEAERESAELHTAEYSLFESFEDHAARE